MMNKLIFLVLTIFSPHSFAQNSSAAALAEATFSNCVAQESQRIQSACAGLASSSPERNYTYLSNSVAFPNNTSIADYQVNFLCGIPVPVSDIFPDGFNFLIGGFCLHPRSIGQVKPEVIIDSSHDVGTQPKNPICAQGSIINLDARSVGEQVSISGAPFSLSYQTQFDPGRVAGKTIDLSFTFNGEFQLPRAIKLVGTNSTERRLNFPAIGSVQLKYVLNSADLISKSPFIDSDEVSLQLVSAIDTGYTSSFKKCNPGTLGQRNELNCEDNNEANLKVDTDILNRSYKLSSYKPKVWGLGGWTLTNHHYYDAIAQTIYYGFSVTRVVAAANRDISPYGTVFVVAAEDASEVYIFDQFGRHLETKTGLVGATKFKFQYLPDHKLDQIIDQNNLVTKVLRDSEGRPTGIQGPFGQLTALEVNVSGKLSVVRSATDAVTEISYFSENGLLSRIVYPSGLVTDFSHSEDGLFIGEIKNTGGFQQLTETFENLKKLLSFTTAEGSGQKNIDDRSGQFSSVRTQLNVNNESAIRTEISSNGLNEKVTAPNYSSEKTFQNDIRFGSQVLINQNSFERSFNSPIYTSAISTTQAVAYLSGEGPFDIDSLATTSTISLPNTVRKSVFSGVERSISSIQDNILQSKIFLDEKERVSKIQSPGFLDLNLSYNNLGQVIQAAQGSSFFNYSYDVNGNLVEERDTLGRSTFYDRDLDGKVLSKTMPNGDRIEFDYNSSGTLKSLRTPNNQVHRFQQTLLDQVASYIPPVFGSENGQSVYEYDLDGRIKTITKPGGAIARFFYKSGTDFIERIQTPEGNYLFQDIDALGRPMRVISPDGVLNTTTFIEETIVKNSWSDISSGSSGNIEFQLNGLFQVIGAIVNDSIGFSFSYDELGRITAAGAETYVYTNSNQVIPGSGGSVSNVAVQQVISNLAQSFSTTSSIETSDAPGLDPTTRRISMEITKPDGFVRLETRESVDVAGNISLSARKSVEQSSQFKEDHFQQFLIYDQNNRLIQIDEAEESNSNGQISVMPRRPVAQYTFGRNSNNNIQSYEHFGKLTTATYGPQDRLLKLTGAIQRDFEYGPDGTLSKISNCLGEKKFEYDFFGNLKKVTLPDGRIITYKTDGFNRRVAKFVNGVKIETYTWYDQTRLAAINPVSGARIIYAYGAHPIAPSYVQIGNRTYKVIPSWKGDIRYLVADDGSIAQELIYDEYGNTLTDTSLGRTVNGQVVNAPLQPLGFVSGLTDFDTKMIRFGARDYDPVVGRWVAKDPIGFAGGDTNLYSYVGQNPLNAIDPTGLSDINLFPLGDPLLAWDTRINTPSNVFSVGGHGSPTRIVDPYGNTLSPEDLANLIRKNSKYQPGMQVELNSCSTGGSPSDGAASYAQRLSNILNAQVTAPTNTLFINSKGGRRVLDPGGFRTFSPNR